MAEIVVKRELNVVTAEIVAIKTATQRMVIDSSIEIGRRLCEAKEIIGHGNWGEYLKNEVEFSQSTANNLMRIYHEFGDEQLALGKEPKSQTYRKINYSQAIQLLALPEEDREDIVKNNDMENTSVSELKKIIEEKTKQITQLSNEVEQKSNIEKERDKLQGVLTVKTKELAEKQAALEALQKTDGPSDEDIQVKIQDATKKAEKETEKRLKADFEAKNKQEIEKAKAKLEQDMKKLRDEIEQSKREKEAKEQLLKAQQEENEKLKKTALVSGTPEVDRFKERFEGLQNEINRITTLLGTIKEKEPQTAEKLKAAMLRYADIFRQQVEGI